MEINDSERFFRILNELEQDDRIIKMKEYAQHNGNNTWQHCRNVAGYSFYLAQKWGVKVDEESLAKGAMLHDYYLYSTREMDMSDFRHGVSHPKLAYRNALTCFSLNQTEKNIILSHMWPLNPVALPLCTEAWLVSLADKYCAAREMISEGKAIEPGVKTSWIRAGVLRVVRSAVS